ncbi:MAG: penicillin acylase family protein [Deltaproteobacteria bacterium]|nr:penicillin acylase family protein [Deltaproteobacteria bacterium]
MRGARTAFAVVVAVTVCGCGDDDGAMPPPGGPADGGAVASRRVVVSRDSYGVPHIAAADVRGASYALGWVEAEDQRDVLLGRLWAAAGRSAEKAGDGCGTPCLEADVRVLVDRVPESVERGYPSLAPRTREVIEAYVDGVNAFFAQADPAAGLWFADDPITPSMVVAAQLAARIAHARASTTADITPETGSNQLVVTGARAAPDTTVVLKDPHNLWTGSEPYAHVRVGEHDLVGNWFGGALGCGTNGFVAFGCTRSTPVSAASVRLRLRYGALRESSEPCGAYTEAFHADHAAGTELVPFAMRCISVARRGEPPFTGWAYDSRFGTLEHAGDDTDGDGLPDEAFVTHVFAATDLGFMDYLVDRTYVRTSEELLGLYAAPTPREDAQYRAFGSRDHVIGFVLGAAVPVLDESIDWHSPVSSEDPRIDGWNPNGDWSVLDNVEFYDVDGIGPELPNVIRPLGDLVQNCNGNPRWATEPVGQMAEAPGVLEAIRAQTVRDERMRELVLGSTALDAAGVQSIATDVGVAAGRRLVEAIRCGLAITGADPVATWGDGGRLLEILIAWSALDYGAVPESEAMTVMYLLDATRLVDEYPSDGECWPMTTIDRLAVALRDALAPAMRRLYGASHDDPLHVPWGWLNRVVVGGVERGVAGAGGNLATLFVNAFEVDTGTGRGKPDVHLGSRVTQVTSFGPEGHEVWVTMPHGQIDEDLFPDSPHVGQTIDDYVARRFRRVPLAPEEIAADPCPYGDPASPSFDPAHEHATRVELVLPWSP